MKLVFASDFLIAGVIAAAEPDFSFSGDLQIDAWPPSFLLCTLVFVERVGKSTTSCWQINHILHQRLGAFYESHYHQVQAAGNITVRHVYGCSLCTKPNPAVVCRGNQVMRVCSAGRCSCCRSTGRLKVLNLPFLRMVLLVWSCSICSNRMSSSCIHSEL